MRTRTDKSANYRAAFTDYGKTIRMRLDNSLPILQPSTPELEDIGLNTLCKAGCSYCYTSAITNGQNFPDIISKAKSTWGKLQENERPFQLAIGGSGEPTLHPDFIEFCKTVRELGIMPNYTTNGMHLSPEVLEATESICGGVALSFHPHIEPVFHKAAKKLVKLDTKLNVHIIVGTEQSFTDLKRLFEQYEDVFDYFVILPYQVAGRAQKLQDDVQEVWKETLQWISKLPNQNKFAFGALFFEFLQENQFDLDMSIYEPEIYSGYRLMDESFETVRKSSYDLSPKYS